MRLQKVGPQQEQNILYYANTVHTLTIDRAFRDACFHLQTGTE